MTSSDNHPKFGEPVLVEFTEEEIRGCKDIIYEPIARGYTHILTLLYLPCRVEWLKSYKRECQNLLVDGNEDFWMFRVSISFNDKVHYCLGSGHSKREASDSSCYRFTRMLRELYPGFAMPQYVIGYPNIRGHCFVISALLPLLHSFPFICEIFDAKTEFEIRLNAREIDFKLARRDSSEAPFYWTNTLYKVYREYRKASIDGELELNNGMFVSWFKSSKMRLVRKKPRIIRPDKDLQLDKNLVKGLVSCLKTYCDEEYFATPGGDERDVYKYLISKLGSEIPGFMEKFAVKVSVKYTCRLCSGGPYASDFFFPVVSVPANCKFEDLFENAVVMVSKQVVDCSHTVNGYTCQGLARSVFHAEFISLPRVLCLGVEYEEEDLSVPIPEELKIHHGDKDILYQRLASSVCIEGYENEDGESYGDGYHEPLPGDKEAGGHTFVHLKTLRGFCEVNNGVLYCVDKRVFGRTTPSSIHVYQLKSYMHYLPDINRDQLQETSDEE